jgi:DNA polymerase II large subunit
MNNNFEEELKKIRYREDRIATETEILNDYKRRVLRKITETQGWENLLNGPYKSKYANNSEELLSNLFFIDVDNKGVLRVYYGTPGHVNTHEILSFN